jgi:hypothetical protein
MHRIGHRLRTTEPRIAILAFTFSEHEHPGRSGVNLGVSGLARSSVAALPPA